MCCVISNNADGFWHFHNVIERELLLLLEDSVLIEQDFITELLGSVLLLDFFHGFVREFE